MPVSRLEPGKTYRLRMDLEVRDEQTGTLRAYLRRGNILTVKKAEPEQERVWVEGISHPIPDIALMRLVDPVE